MLDRLVIRYGVNVLYDRRVAHFYWFRRVEGEECAPTLISFDGHQLVEQAPVEQDRIAAPALEGGQNDGRQRFAVALNNPCDDRGGQPRLIGQDKEGCTDFRSQGLKAHSHRGGLALCPIGVENDPDRSSAQGLPYCRCYMT